MKKNVRRGRIFCLLTALLLLVPLTLSNTANAESTQEASHIMTPHLAAAYAMAEQNDETAPAAHVLHALKAPTKIGREAPTGLAGIAPSVQGAADGKITGTTKEMEYRSAGGEWQDVPAGELTGLGAGTYELRFKETGTYLASKIATVEVPQGKPVSPQHITELSFSIYRYEIGKAVTSIQVNGQTDGVNLVDAYLLAFDTDTQTWKPAKGTIKAGTKYRLSISFSAKKGYDFDGLSNDKIQLATIGSALTYDAAKGEVQFSLPELTEEVVPNNYTLSFETNDGSILAPIVKPENTTIDLSDIVPTKDGYTFEGWYADAQLTEKITAITLTKDTTVYAKWKQKTGSVTPDPQTPERPQTPQPPQTPERPESKTPRPSKQSTTKTTRRVIKKKTTKQLPQTADTTASSFSVAVLLAAAGGVFLLRQKIKHMQ